MINYFGNLDYLSSKKCLLPAQETAGIALFAGMPGDADAYMGKRI
jgi:hypothetical protein